MEEAGYSEAMRALSGFSSTQWTSDSWEGIKKGLKEAFKTGGYLK
jgi:hypothetical protein